MSEVEKMYENCNIKPKQKGYCDWDSSCPYPHHKCNDECPYWKYENEAKYPPFTAEKQLELLKICFDKYKRLEKVRGLKERCIIYYRFDKNGYTEFVNCETWEETFAGLINNLWQDLTDAEKAQIKNVLESEVRE